MKGKKKKERIAEENNERYREIERGVIYKSSAILFISTFCSISN